MIYPASALKQPQHADGMFTVCVCVCVLISFLKAEHICSHSEEAQRLKPYLYVLVGSFGPWLSFDSSYGSPVWC